MGLLSLAIRKLWKIDLRFKYLKLNQNRDVISKINPENRTIQQQAAFPLRKFNAEQMFVLLRTKRMQLRNHADTQPVKRSQR